MKTFVSRNRLFIAGVTVAVFVTFLVYFINSQLIPLDRTEAILSNRLESVRAVAQSRMENISSSLENETIECTVDNDLQYCLDTFAGKTIILEKGTHWSYGAVIHGNTTLVIPEGAVVKLADNAQMPFKGGAVLKAEGTSEVPVENISIVLHGIIDGNKQTHPYEKSGIEGIGWSWVSNSSIVGTGIVRNASGDGVDIDAVSNSFFSGITIRSNSGSGFHLGSPRPIASSWNNVVYAIQSEKNGYKVQRRGFDQSWPNIDGVVYINCIAKDNYKNWLIDGEGAIVLGSSSIDTGGVNEKDDFEDALLAVVNEQIYINGKRNRSQHARQFRSVPLSADHVNSVTYRQDVHLGLSVPVKTIAFTPVDSLVTGYYLVDIGMLVSDVSSSKGLVLSLGSKLVGRAAAGWNTEAIQMPRIQDYRVLYLSAKDTLFIDDCINCFSADDVEINNSILELEFSGIHLSSNGLSKRVKTLLWLRKSWLGRHLVNFIIY